MTKGEKLVKVLTKYAMAQANLNVKSSKVDGLLSVHAEPALLVAAQAELDDAFTELIESISDFRDTLQGELSEAIDRIRNSKGKERLC